MAMPQSGTMPPTPGMYGPPPPMPRKRPLGVTIIAILTILGGLVAIFGGFALLVLGAVAAAALGPIGAYVAIIGGVLLLVGILSLAAGVGLLRLRGWAWWLTIITNVLILVLNGATQSWTGVVLPLIIIIYLVVVRQHFGIGGSRPAGM